MSSPMAAFEGYEVLHREGTDRWEAGFFTPYRREWQPDSAFSTLEQAAGRARWLNGVHGRYVYRSGENGLWAVGRYVRHGRWEEVQACEGRDAAAELVHELNRD